MQAFLSLPSQVQGILIAGFAVNKLSGGLIGQGFGLNVGECIILALAVGAGRPR